MYAMMHAYTVIHGAISIQYFVGSSQGLWCGYYSREGYYSKKYSVSVLHIKLSRKETTKEGRNDIYSTFTLS